MRYLIIHHIMHLLFQSYYSSLDSIITLHYYSTHFWSPGTEEHLATMLPLQDLLPPNTNTFYRYSGSLTTPTCNEVVTWTVFQEPISISENQVSEINVKEI